MKKLVAFILAVACVTACFAACSESSSSDIGSSSANDSSLSSSGLDSSVIDDSSESQTTTTTTSETTTTTTSEATTTTTTTASETTTSSQSVTTKNTAPAPVPVGSDLKTVATTVFNAKEIKCGSKPKSDFIKASDNGPGVYSMYADIKTADLFDPFDDLYLNSSQKALEAAKADVQVFFHGTGVELEQTKENGEVKKTKSTDGYIFAMNFNCKDEAEAKKVYSLVMTEEMKKNVLTDADKPVYEFGADYAMAYVTENGLTTMMCYYRIGNNVFAAGMYDVMDFRGAKPLNYTKQLDYWNELDKLCKAFGAAKLPSSIKK